MVFFYGKTALTLALAISSACAGPHEPVVVHTRTAPGGTDEDTLRVVSQALASARLHERATPLNTSISLDKSWEGATLFSFEASKASNTKNSNSSISSKVEIVCSTCYVKGKAMTKFNVEPGFNASNAFRNFTREVKGEVANLTSNLIDFVENSTDTILSNLSDGFDPNDFDLPPVDLDFNVKLPAMPEASLSFIFDGLEIFMKLDTVLSGSATYTLRLFTSNTPVGFGVGTDLTLGIIFTVDLILSVDAAIDISTGVHIKLEDGVGINIPMFSKNVSKIAFPGGRFEFLPVTVESAGTVMQAVLRLGVHAGLSVSETKLGAGFSVGAGVEVSVWADVVEFTTNVTAVNDEKGCDLRIVEAYQFALGAAAGATAALGTRTWGPAPQTQVPIFYTTLAAACVTAGHRRSSSSLLPTTATVKGRADLTTTTISTEVTHTGVACLSTGLINCPASLQSTTKFTETVTLTTSVPSGSQATFPPTTLASVPKTVAFGKDAIKLISSTGSPVSFVPPPPPTAPGKSSTNDKPSEGSSKDGPNLFKGETGGVSNKVIIGVSVGVGVPALMAIGVGVYLCTRKRSGYSPASQDAGPRANDQLLGSERDITEQSKKPPQVSVSERSS